MRSQKRFVVLATLVPIALSCSFPSDESQQVFVTVSSPETAFIVRRGAQLPLVARMWHVSGTDTVEIRNVGFNWISTDNNLAIVAGGGTGTASVIGVNAGLVNITARATAFEGSADGQFMVRVSETVEIDSVRPRVVRWGEQLTVYGVGVDSIVLSYLDNINLYDYPIPGLLATRTRDPSGLATATFWVPPPAHTDSVSYIGPGVFGFARETTYVLPFDVYEPNETAPWTVDLEGPPIVPQAAAIRFFNPAVAFEAPRRDELGADWYRFTQSTVRDLTLIINSAGVSESTYIADSLYWDAGSSQHMLGADAWLIGPGFHVCHGLPFLPLQLSPDSLILAIRQPSAPPVMHTLSIYREPGRYSLTAVEGYVASRPSIPRDDHEEDDFCNAADAQAHPSANAGFRDTLTIDNPFELDWLRFRVTAASAVQFRLASLVAQDTLSDIDLYVLSDTTNNLTEIASGVNAGSSESFATALTAGEYYAVVVDYAGVPVRYAICVGTTTACAVFPGPSPAAPNGTRRKTGPRTWPVGAPRSPRVPSP